MPGVERIVHLHKRAYVDGLINLAREAGAGDPEMLGNQLALLYEGASTVDLAQRSAALAACPSGGGGPHFDVVAAARTASLTAVGVIATTVFWARLTISSR